jgi:predicted metal-dependent phosphoesterase TrpH
MILSDFHIHSNFSDGKHSIPEIVDFYGKRGFGAIAITDHLCENRTFLGKAAAYLERTLTPANFPFYLEILKSEKKRALNQYGMVLIPGVEITKNSISNHRSAHVIGLGITQWVDANLPMEDVLIQLRAQDAVTVAAHPLSNNRLEKQTEHLWSKREFYAPLFDAWEVGSGTHYFKEVAESGLPMIASTDLHRFSQINGWKSVVDAQPKADLILEAIKRQKISFRYYEENHGRNSQLSPLDFVSGGNRHWNLGLISTS